MAKTKRAADKPTFVKVRYDLLDLPTAQHRAGLAGLVLQVESMKERGLASESVPHLEMIGASAVAATFTKASLCGLFDDLYDAKPALVESASKWSGATIVDERVRPDPKTGKTKKVFVYKVVQPQGHFFRRYTDDGKEIWRKLWRDMLWAIPRGKPTTRGPFNNRAAGKSSGEGESFWVKLLAMDKAQGKGQIPTCELAGALLLGAQAVNAETVPFRDRVDHALLLHFWQLTARTFVPEQVDSDGKREFAGYVLAIPDVTDLSQFCRRYKRALGALTDRASGYRPADAVISLPAEGALEFMDGLARLAGEATSVERSDVARALTGVEFFHMIKTGNNVKTMTHGRISPTPALLTEYEAITRTSRNPMFRTARLLAMLHGQPWYSECGTLMAERPWPLFVRSEDTPRTLPSFAWDATRKFQASLQNEQTRKVHAMKTGSPAPLTRLETLVYRLVRTYVRAKTEQRSGISYTDFKDKKVTDDKGRVRTDYPRPYTEAQEKICSDLFLGLRSRRDDDFVSYFTGTIGSVAQGPNLSDEAGFRVIAEALLNDDDESPEKSTWRDVQTLAMLAVSAASYASTRAEDDEDTTTTEEVTR